MVQGPLRIGHQMGRQVGERLVLARRVVAVVAVDGYFLLLALLIHVALPARLAALARDVRRATVDAAHRLILHPLPVTPQQPFHAQYPGQGPTRWGRSEVPFIAQRFQVR